MLTHTYPCNHTWMLVITSGLSVLLHLFPEVTTPTGALASDTSLQRHYLNLQLKLADWTLHGNAGTFPCPPLAEGRGRTHLGK